MEKYFTHTEPYTKMSVSTEPYKSFIYTTPESADLCLVFVPLHSQGTTLAFCGQLGASLCLYTSPQENRHQDAEQLAFDPKVQVASPAPWPPCHELEKQHLDNDSAEQTFRKQVYENSKTFRQVC